MSTLPLVPPLFPVGKEPLPPGFTEDDRQVMLQNKRMQNYMQMGMESCIVKTAMAAGMGFGMGAFISLMSSSFAYEDPLIRQQQQAIGAISTTTKAKEIFAEMGRGMWRSGKGFAKVTVLFAGTECVIESYRARNDIGNAVAAGFIAGGVLARNTGPRGALWGGLGFAAFSAAIDLFLRRETPEED